MLKLDSEEDKVTLRTKVRDFLTSVKVLMAFGTLLLGAYGYTINAANTATNAEDKADTSIQQSGKNTDRITKIERDLAAIPYIQDDIEELKENMDNVEGQISQIKQSQARSEAFNRAQAQKSDEQYKRQMDLLERALKNSGMQEDRWKR